MNLIDSRLLYSTGKLERTRFALNELVKRAVFEPSVYLYVGHEKSQAKNIIWKDPEPQLIKKGQTRFDGLDEKIISLYSRGMMQREIQGHLEEIYGVDISPSLISTVSDAQRVRDCF